MFPRERRQSRILGYRNNLPILSIGGACLLEVEDLMIGTDWLVDSVSYSKLEIALVIFPTSSYSTTGFCLLGVTENEDPGGELRPFFFFFTLHILWSIRDTNKGSWQVNRRSRSWIYHCLAVEQHRTAYWIWISLHRAWQVSTSPWQTFTSFFTFNPLFPWQCGIIDVVKR